jgi:hypothetical protein
MMQFIALRLFYLQGEAIGAGDLVEIKDARLAAELLSLGRIEFADAATARRFTRFATVEWRPATERQAGVGEIAFISRAVRDHGDDGPWRPWAR